MLLGRLKTTLGKPKGEDIKILLDSGANASLVAYDKVKNLQLKQTSTTNWNTAAGNFKTAKTVKADFKLPEFYTNRIINWKFHVTSSLGRYDMILGRDILNELEMGTDFKTKKMTWDGGEVPMKDMNNHDVKKEFLMQWECNIQSMT